MWISAVVVAAAAGVSSHFLESRVRPVGWGSPAEIRWNGGEMCYARARLPELVIELERLGLYEAAINLRAWVNARMASPVPWYQRGAMA